MQRFATVLLFAAVALVQVEARGDIKLFDCSKMKSICSAACYYDRELGGDSWMTDGFNYDNSADKESHKSKRRAAIGCKSKNCGSGQSCDEYPFASSYQGGLGVVGGGYPTMRDGFNVCVPQGEQSSQGGQLKGFVSGKPDGYNYEPHVSNAGGIANCDTKQTPSEPATFRHVTTPQNRRRANAQPPIAQGYETQSGVRFVTFGKRDIYSLGTTVWTANTTHPDGGSEEPIVRHFSNLDGFSWE